MILQHFVHQSCLIGTDGCLRAEQVVGALGDKRSNKERERGQDDDNQRDTPFQNHHKYERAQYRQKAGKELRESHQ